MSSFLASLDSGVLRWDLLQDLPQQDPADRAAGDGPLQDLRNLLAEKVDPEALDATRELPPGLLDALRAGGYLRLAVGREHGGLALSPYNTFRLVEEASLRSVPIGQLLAVANGAGVPALLPVLPPGPLREFVAGRIAAGTISGWADTEPTGQNNRYPATTATPTPDGTGYRLHGEKVFTGNGPVADLLVVTASVAPAGDGTGEAPAAPRVCLCFVDTRSSGFQMVSRLEFMGGNGLPNAALRFDDVHVPGDRVLSAEAGDIRQSPAIASVGLIGRLYIAVAPALAIARQCLAWQRDFLGRRSIDGRGLGEYDEVQRIVATSLADLYAMESVVRRCLLGDAIAAHWYEQLAAKNILTMTAWGIVDRTMSLLAGEGFETAGSKRRRGAPAFPVERAFRDARGLRIAGNVDFQLDYQTARLLLARFAAAGATPIAQADHAEPAQADLTGGELSPANRAHLAALAGQLRRLTAACRELTARQPDPVALHADEHRLIQVARIAGELFTMSAVLARSSTSDDGDQELSDVYCTGARHRLAGYWRELSTGAEPDYAKISRGWLAVQA
jgi:alkylation response protein AidB-like acyl-CoA dehydrogenase